MVNRGVRAGLQYRSWRRKAALQLQHKLTLGAKGMNLGSVRSSSSSACCGCWSCSCCSCCWAATRLQDGRLPPLCPPPDTQVALHAAGCHLDRGLATTHLGTEPCCSAGPLLVGRAETTLVNCSWLASIFRPGLNSKCAGDPMRICPAPACQGSCAARSTHHGHCGGGGGGGTSSGVLAGLGLLDHLCTASLRSST